MAEAEPLAREQTAATTAFVTTEHFTLQGARSQTVSESTGRASIFLASASGGVVAPPNRTTRHESGRPHDRPEHAICRGYALSPP
jgi:hypothetical protein